VSRGRQQEATARNLKGADAITQTGNASGFLQPASQLQPFSIWQLYEPTPLARRKGSCGEDMKALIEYLKFLIRFNRRSKRVFKALENFSTMNDEQLEALTQDHAKLREEWEALHR
jgi:hypothetical protein